MARGQIRLLTPQKIKRFSEILNRHELSAPIRVPRGRDIMAACGQLKSASERTRARDRTPRRCTVTPLPVLGTVLGAYAFVWRERRQFWQLTLPPLVILAILTALVQWGTVSSSVTLDGVGLFPCNGRAGSVYCLLCCLCSIYGCGSPTALPGTEVIFCPRTITRRSTPTDLMAVKFAFFGPRVKFFC